jgi:hypothetical protein
MIVPPLFESGALIAAERRHQADSERLLAQAPRPPAISLRHHLAVLLLRIGTGTNRVALRLDATARTYRGAGSA